MGRFFALLITIVFHPLCLPIMSMYVLFNIISFASLKTPEILINFVYSLVFLFTFLIPAVVCLLLYKTNLVSDLEMNSHKERRIPYLITSILYTVTYYILQKYYLPSAILLSFLGACLALLITMMINLFWKISAHTVAIGGLTGAVAGVSMRYMLDLRLVLSIIALVAGLVGWSRLKLEAHSLPQVLAGYAVGIGSQLILLLGIK